MNYIVLVRHLRFFQGISGAKKRPVTRVGILVSSGEKNSIANRV
jgi:hypothetical protein